MPTPERNPRPVSAPVITPSQVVVQSTPSRESAAHREASSAKFEDKKTQERTSEPRISPKVVLSLCYIAYSGLLVQPFGIYCAALKSPADNILCFGACLIQWMKKLYFSLASSTWFALFLSQCVTFCALHPFLLFIFYHNVNLLRSISNVVQVICKGAVGSTIVKAFICKRALIAVISSRLI